MYAGADGGGGERDGGGDGPAVPDACVLDVRELDEPPVDAIRTALADLDRRGTLVVVSGFEPDPLYDVLAAQGFVFETSRVAADEWRVVVEPE